MIPTLLASFAVQAGVKITGVDPFIALANCTLTKPLGTVRAFDYALKRQNGKWVNDLILYSGEHASLGKLSPARVTVENVNSSTVGENIISIQSSDDIGNTNMRIMAFIKVINKRSNHMEAAVRMMSNTSGSSNASDAQCNVTLFEFAEERQ